MDESWLIWVVSQLPSLYIVLTSILICWGAFVSFAFWNIINLVKSNTPEEKPEHESEVCINCNRIRRCDRVHFVITSIILSINIFSVILTPIFFQSVVDILFVSNFWIAVYYSFLTFTSLKHWPEMFISGQARKSQEDPNENRTHYVR